MRGAIPQLDLRYLSIFKLLGDIDQQCLGVSNAIRCLKPDLNRVKESNIPISFRNRNRFAVLAELSESNFFPLLYAPFYFLRLFDQECVQYVST